MLFIGDKYILIIKIFVLYSSTVSQNNIQNQYDIKLIFFICAEIDRIKKDSYKKLRGNTWD